MNAKELRAAAINLKRHMGIVYASTASMGPTPIQRLAGTLIDHILATVREDDDEPIDDSWFASISDHKQRVMIGDGRCVERDDFGSIFIDADGTHCDFPITTRGEFRALCRLLGMLR